jgi:hypothetical protein
MQQMQASVENPDLNKVVDQICGASKKKKSSHYPH